MARRGVKVTVAHQLARGDRCRRRARRLRETPQAAARGWRRLLELKRTAAPERPGSRRPGGSSGSSLHAKTFAVDRSRVFVGSFNFDPRSAHLNTEIGFVIESPSLAARLAGVVDGTLAEGSYRVELGADGALRWVDRAGGTEVVHDREPGAGVGDGLLWACCRGCRSNGYCRRSRDPIGYCSHWMGQSGRWRHRMSTGRI